MTADRETVWLVGDIGATNARFGLASPAGAVLHSSTFADADFATIGDAIRAYLAQAGSFPRPRIGCLAIAAPVSGDDIRMTNHPWSFSVAALRDELGFERFEVINDFTAVALALPRLGPSDRVPVGGGAPVPGRPIAVLGPGSGLGASGLIPAGSGWLSLTGEGGHVTMPAV
ncbi:MAG: glucokinase, partial [Alphaproteobacteria bacterium]